MDVVAFLLGAGSGLRMGGVAKAFINVLGRPAFYYSLMSMKSTGKVDQAILVLPENLLERGRQMIEQFGFQDFVQLTAGGETRLESVAKALKISPPSRLILIHDAARVCVTPDLITESIILANNRGSAVPLIPVVDTLKNVDQEGKILRTLTRDGLYAAQTPQTFKRSDLVDAHSKLPVDNFTDDSSLLESYGVDVRSFTGDVENLKITFSSDILIAESILLSRGTSVKNS
jgi:2-C-methyl-D-erythritol 4-phosphate cytidylyltransferase